MTNAQRLVSRGMSPRAAEDKATLFQRLPDAPRKLFVPGRVEFLGKHTDYAGGKSLLCAVERGFCISAAPRSDRRIIIRDAIRQLESAFELDSGLQPLYGTWGSYGMVVARRLARNFPPATTGAEITFASDLSPAAGMSTSSALITGITTILLEFNNLAGTGTLGSPECLAEYLGAIECGSGYHELEGDDGVGTFGGSQDHTAILLSQPGRLILSRFGPVSIEGSVAFPAGYVLVIAVSGFVAEKTGAARTAYNRISRATTRILHYWNEATGRNDPTLMAAVGQSPEAHHELREILEDVQDPEFEQGVLLARLEQLVMETTVLIPDAMDAIRNGDLAGLGATVDVSQLLAERMLENQVPETVRLAALARELGAVAASAFGAGFGGSVYAVVEESAADAFKERWMGAYLAEFPERESSVECFLTKPGPALTVL